MSSSTVIQSEFSRWRRYLWPVYRGELRKLLPMLLIFFFVALNYNILRTLKDSLLITAKSSGAEVIPFVKVWAMFPGAILMTWLYTRLSRRLSREKLFYFFVSFFLIYFFLFTFVLYPARDFLHPHQLADQMETVFPKGCKGFIAMFRYWTFTLFYVMSELWGAIILFVLLWGFANQVTTVGEAKRFYGLLGIGANCSGIFAGQFSVFLCQSDFICHLPFGHSPWERSLMVIVTLILFSGIVTMALFRWLHVSVLSHDSHFQEIEKEAIVEKSKRPKASFRQNFRYLFSSKYLIAIAVIVVAYNMVINLTEVLWKHQVKELYSSPQEYTLYMNHIVSIVGVIATLTSVFISGNSIRKLGWTFTALLTPFILLVTSFGFFFFFFLKEGAPLLALKLIGFDPLILAVFFGSLQNVMSRAAKYTVFDATKEMSFIPLGEESKIMGKAAIDGVCSRLGKSGGALIYQGLLLSFVTISASAPYVGFFLFVIILVWMGAVQFLGKKFTLLTQKEKEPFPSMESDPSWSNPANRYQEQKAV